MRAVSALDLSLPISMGQVLLEDVAGTGIALVATRSLP
jgi:CxxC motif-containing protein